MPFKKLLITTGSMLPRLECFSWCKLERDVALACGMRVVDFGENKIIYVIYGALKKTLERLLKDSCKSSY